MDKRLKEVLKNCGFEPEYSAFVQARAHIQSDFPMEIPAIQSSLVNLGLTDVSYHAKEKFFKYLEPFDQSLIQLNIACSPSRIECILFIQNESIKLKDGGPFGLLAKRMNPKLKFFSTIPFDSSESFEEGLKFGVGLYNRIRQECIHSGLLS